MRVDRPTKPPSEGPPALRRSLGFWALAAYGTGDILGAGIYALVGQVAAAAGHAAWVSFALTVVIAGLTALSYAELGSRYPRAGGEAYFCEKAFRWPGVALLIGFLVLASGVVSLATVAHACVGYLLEPLGIEAWFAQTMGLLVFLIALAVINFWGMRQSSMANILCTLVEIAGLVLVIAVGLMAIRAGNVDLPEKPPASSWSWSGILQGSALAFFAFIGFEDMVNASQEVRHPRRNLPAAILTALFVAACMYMLVAWVATSLLTPDVLAASDAPLSDVVEKAAPWLPNGLFSIVAIFAVANTGLLNFIMGSRLIYGMSLQGLVPSWLAAVHPATRTPHRAILAVLLIAIVLALMGTLRTLAGTTNVLLLVVFSVVNVALVVLKLRPGYAKRGFRVPIAAPILGAMASLGLIAFAQWRSLLLALALLTVGALAVSIWWKLGKLRSPS